MSLPTRRNGGPILPFTLDDRTSSSPLGTSHRSVLRSLFRNRLFLVFCGIGLFLFTFGLPRGLQPPGPRWPKPPPPPHHGPHHHDWLDDDEFDKPLLEKAHKALDEDSELWSARAGEVKAEFLHAYHAYEKYAMPRDELRPLSKGSIDKCVWHFLPREIRGNPSYSNLICEATMGGASPSSTPSTPC